MFTDKTIFPSAIKHYLLADILFAILFGGGLQIILVSFLGHKAYFFSQGVGGVLFDAVITTLSIMASAFWLKHEEKRLPVPIALFSTAFVALTVFVSLPYIGVLADVNRITSDFLLLRNIIHVVVFLIVSVVVFKKMPKSFL